MLTALPPHWNVEAVAPVLNLHIHAGVLVVLNGKCELEVRLRICVELHNCEMDYFK